VGALRQSRASEPLVDVVRAAGLGGQPRVRDAPGGRVGCRRWSAPQPSRPHWNARRCWNLARGGGGVAWSERSISGDVPRVVHDLVRGAARFVGVRCARRLVAPCVGTPVPCRDRNHQLQPVHLARTDTALPERSHRHRLSSDQLLADCRPAAGLERAHRIRELLGHRVPGRAPAVTLRSWWRVARLLRRRQGASSYGRGSR